MGVTLYVRRAASFPDRRRKLLSSSLKDTSRINPFELRITVPQEKRRGCFKYYATIEEARAERDRLCEIHGIKRAIKDISQS